MKLTLSTVAALILFAATLTATGAAHAASAPILVKRTSEVAGSGKTRVIDCAVSVDGIVITRTYDGITATEERNFSLSGSISAKINDAAAVKAEPTKAATADMSYFFIAYRTNGGAREEVMLSYFDGVKGENYENLSSGSGTLRGILNSVCR